MYSGFKRCCADNVAVFDVLAVFNVPVAVVMTELVNVFMLPPLKLCDFVW